MQKKHSVTDLKFLKDFGAAMNVASPEGRSDIVAAYFKSIDTQKNFSWIVPQAQAALVRECPVALGSDGFVSIAGTFSDIDDLTLGLMWLLKEGPGQFVSPAWQHPEYSVFVPLILDAYKKYADIKYSKWDIKQLKYVVSPAQYEYMTEKLPEVDDFILIEDREACASRFRSLKTAHAPDVKGDHWKGISKYGKCLMLQVWLAHPEVRCKEMWLDSSNPDYLPPPLVESNPITNAAVSDFMALIKKKDPEVKKPAEVASAKFRDIPPWET